MLYDYWGKDIEIVFDTCYQCAALGGFFGKICTIFWQREKIARMYEAMDNHWNIFTNKSEVQILKDSSSLSRKLTSVYTIMMYGMTIIFILVPLTPVFLDIIYPLNETRPRLYLLNMKFRMDYEKYYTQIYCYITVIIVINIFGMIANDVTFLICVIHACSLFSIVSRQLKELIKKPHVNNKYITKIECCMNTELEFENERIIHQEYIICLKKYQLALEFVDMLNSTYQIVSLFLLILYGATVTFCGIKVINVLNQLTEIIKYTFAIIGILIQLMMLCFYGEKLKDESQNVFYQAYAIEWYNCSPRLKSLLIITLYKSIVPCTLTASDVIPLSIETYGLVIRTAGSYFMTFLSLKK